MSEEPYFYFNENDVNEGQIRTCYFFDVNVPLRVR